MQHALSLIESHAFGRVVVSPPVNPAVSTPIQPILPPLPPDSAATPPIQPHLASLATSSENLPPTSRHLVQTRMDDTLHIHKVVVGSTNSPVTLVFDTETASLTGSVIQLGWVTIDMAGNITNQYCRFWRLKQDEDIDARAFKVHNISDTMLAELGICPVKEIQSFRNVCKAVADTGGRIVAHNATFDVNRLNYTCAKNGLSPILEKKDVFCTMRQSAKFCNLKNVQGRQRCPKNVELYEILTGVPPEGQLHDALADCRITAVAFVKGSMRGWW